MNWATRNRTVLLIFVLLTVVLMLSSCMPRFRQPLDVHDTLFPDNDLIGVWYTPGSNFWSEYYLLTIVKMEGGHLRILYTDDKSVVTEYQGYAVILGENDYINAWPMVRENKDDKIPRFYYICHYCINADGDLELWFFNEEFLENAIKKGEIEGRIVIRDGWECEPEIRATTDELRAFLLNYNKSDYLQEEPWPWRKMKM